MNLSWFESLIYGLISGIAEFLPISSHAHQRILRQLFGAHNRDPVLDLFVHIALLASLYSGCRAMFEHLRREQRQHLHRRRANPQTSYILMDERFVRNAVLPMIIGILVFTYVFDTETNLLTTAVFLLLNGIVLFVSGRMMQGNKDVRSMSYLDSLLIGGFASLSAFTGISRVGFITSAGIARGANRQQALKWAFLISIPILILMAVIDILKIISGGAIFSFWGNFFSYLISACGAYIAGYYGLKFMRFLAVRIGFSGFAFYCWGASLFSFLLFLMVA